MQGRYPGGGYDDRGGGPPARDFDGLRRGGGNGSSGRGGGRMNKFEKIAEMRQHSRTGRRKRQIQSLDLSETLAAPSTVAAQEAAFQAAPPSAPGNSFNEQPYAPRTGMYEAFFTGGALSGAVGEAASSLEAGELAAAVDVALKSCKSDGGDGGSPIKSNFGGTLICRKDQTELLRQQQQHKRMKP